MFDCINTSAQTQANTTKTDEVSPPTEAQDVDSIKASTLDSYKLMIAAYVSYAVIIRIPRLLTIRIMIPR